MDKREDDLGILELSELVKERFENAAARMAILGEIQSSLTSSLKARTQEAEELKARFGRGNVPGDQTRRMMQRAAHTLEEYARSNEANAPALEDDLSMAFEAMRRSIVISAEDGFQEHDEAEGLRVIIDFFMATVVQSREQLSRLSNTIARFPRMTSEVNRAKRRAVSSMDRLDRIFESNLSQLGLIRDALTSYLETRPSEEKRA